MFRLRISTYHIVSVRVWLWPVIILFSCPFASAQNGIKLNREFVGKEVQFEIDSTINEQFIHVVWEEGLVPEKFNQVVQIAPTVLLYREYLPELGEALYNHSQPTTIEFLDSAFQTISVVDIWDNRPFQASGDLPITYNHFNAEEMMLVSYDKQTEEIIPTEYSIFTQVYKQGNHVIVFFKQVHLSDYRIVDQKTMLRIFNLEGLLIAEIDLIPTLDNAVISPNGFYMMYKSGGSFGNVNQPFARLEKPAWGLVDIQANKVVYHETEKEGTHLDGIFFTQGLLQSNSTTPFDNTHYDYKVFFDESNQTIYKKFWKQSEWDQLKQEWKTTKNSDWRYYLEKYGFEKIKIK